MSVEGNGSVLRDDGGDGVCIFGADPLGPVHAGKFSTFSVRVLGEFLALDLQFTLNQLILGSKRDEFPSCHGEGAGEETGHTSQAHRRQWVQQATPFQVRDPESLGVRTLTHALPRCRVRLSLEVRHMSAEKNPIPSRVHPPCHAVSTVSRSRFPDRRQSRITRIRNASRISSSEGISSQSNV